MLYLNVHWQISHSLIAITFPYQALLKCMRLSLCVLTNNNGNLISHSWTFTKFDRCSVQPDVRLFSTGLEISAVLFSCGTGVSDTAVISPINSALQWATTSYSIHELAANDKLLECGEWDENFNRCKAACNYIYLCGDSTMSFDWFFCLQMFPSIPLQCITKSEIEMFL